MTMLSELNKQHHTDWKRGDIVEMIPPCQDKGHYRLTGWQSPIAYHVVAIPLDGKYPKSYRAYFHPKSIRRVKP